MEAWKALTEALSTLEEGIQRLTVQVGRPLYILDGNKVPYRYPPSSQHVQFLYAVRVVSGLNSCVSLLASGYVQETGVLLRTIDEFIMIIMFIEEAHISGSPNEAQKKFVEGFFSEKRESMETLQEHKKSGGHVPRKKMHASEGRLMGEFAEPAETQASVRMVYDTLSEYVHGSHLIIMEMYDPQKERFRLQGMLGTPRIEGSSNQLAIYRHRALNTIAILSRRWNDEQFADVLRQTRKDLEASSEYA